MMAAKRLQQYFSSGSEDDQTREERRLKEEQKRKEEARLRKWDTVGGVEGSSSQDQKPKQEKQQIDPTRWTELVYNYSSNPTPSSSSPNPGVPSTHRRSSDSDPSKKIRASEMPNRAQSAVELYAKYPLFVRSSSASKGRSNKSSASLATSYAPAYGVTASSSSSLKTSTSEVSSGTAGASALTLPGVDPALYAGKRLGGGPRRPIAKGVEGLLVVPDVLLRPTRPVSSSLPSGSGPLESPSKGMRRSESEASVTRKSGRSSSALGALKENEVQGVWHRPDEGSEDSRSSVSRSSVSQESGSRRGRKSRSNRSGSRRSVVEGKLLIGDVNSSFTYQ